MIEPRQWQADALNEFLEYHRNLSFLLEVTPGGGKTIFSGFCAARLLQQKLVDFALAVVPTVPIKGGRDAGFLGDWSKIGVQITTVLKDGQDCPSEFQGAVTTYQQLPNLISTIETWVRRDHVRLLMIFDEIHHASEENVWGATVEKLARIATKILCMTGTPFRGDGGRISFVNYDEDGKAKPDFHYRYRQAVTDRVCRPVQFITDDGVAEFIRDEEHSQVRISEVSDEQKIADAARVLFDRHSRWLRETITKADAALDEYRLLDPNAGGLIVCRPGTDAFDTKHLMHVASLVREITGEDQEVISYDDKDANDKIDRFRKSKQRWIVAVRKISEGVDIKRLRVLVMATRPQTELLFRQIVGRVVRVDNPQRPGTATAFIAKFPQLTEWAKQISDEAAAGLNDQEPQTPKTRPSEEQNQTSNFTSMGATHEDGGAISDFGDEFSADEVNAAEREKEADAQLIDIPVTKLAYLRRLHGIIPEPMQPAQDPLQIRKKDIRRRLNSKQRRLAIRRNPEQPDFKALWHSLLRPFGAKSLDDLTDNHSIDVMRQVEAMLDQWLVGGGSDAAAS